ncbi:MAG: hypothetical protein BMS9Abin37_2661 [Acidobacteriota bacterium]|nr:MAG: hypothetical protein BMS9Abin37_2661 [Acidobacteriota bacterium]
MAKAAFSKLTTLPRHRPNRLRIEAIDDDVPTKSPHETLLSELGFFPEVTSMVYAETPTADSRAADRIHFGYIKVQPRRESIWNTRTTR